MRGVFRTVVSRRILLRIIIGMALMAPFALGLGLGCTGTIGDSGGTEALPPGVPPADFAPPPASMRRLLGRQYHNTIEDLLGSAAAEAASAPGDVSLNGFDSIGSAQLSIGLSQVTAYEGSARAIAAAAVADGSQVQALMDCEPPGPADADCHEAFIRRFGRLAFRRSLTDDELSRFVAIAQAAAEAYESFDSGLEYAIATILQSPNFVYRVELGEADPHADNRRVLTGTEMASRLSYFLLDTTPSEALLDLAEAGGLDDAEGVSAAARDMLDEPEARAAIGAFYGELFRLRDIETLVKDAESFPDFTPELAASMRGETLALIEHLAFDQKTSFVDIFDAPYSFVDPTLADFYGVDYPEGETGFVKVTLPDEQDRTGIMSHAAMLALQAHSDGSSPTLRGKFVRESLLCQSIPAPPNDIETALPADSDFKTKKEKLSQHMEDPSCNGCHRVMDPIGFALEGFDGVGRFRTEENGVTIDTTADGADLGMLDGPSGLGAALAEHPNTVHCIVRNFFRHAVAHVEIEGEEAALEKIDEVFETSGYQLKEMIVALVSNEAFRYVGVER